MGTQFVFTSYLVTYLNGIFEATNFSSPYETASMIYVATSVGGFIRRVGLGVISDRLFGGRRKDLLIGVNVCAAVIFVAMAIVVPYRNVMGIGCIAFLFGLTGVSFTGLQLTMVSELAGKRVSGAASGFTLAFGFAGMMALPPLFGAIIDTTGGYTYGWLALALLSVFGVTFYSP